MNIFVSSKAAGMSHQYGSLLSIQGCLRAAVPASWKAGIWQGPHCTTPEESKTSEQTSLSINHRTVQEQKLLVITVTKYSYIYRNGSKFKIGV